MWWAVLGGAAACYLAKLAGLSVPARLVSSVRVRRLVALLPIALLAALIATQTFTTGGGLALDLRVVALGVGVVAVALRAPFLVVVALAAGVVAVLRLVVP